MKEEAKLNESITVFNKEVWIPDTENKIAEWEEFSRSIFCENDAEYKDHAMRTVDELRDFLEALKSDTVTRNQYDRIRLMMW